MTRKQAILAVIDHIEHYCVEDAKLCKAAVILREMANGIPGKIWFDEDIRAAIERFISENGRPPKVKELDTVPYLPPHPCIANIYGMTAGEWLRQNYPGYKVSPRNKYISFSSKKLRDIFVSEFNRIQPANSLEYDRFRSDETPTWGYIAKRLNAATWVALKKLCGVELDDKSHHEMSVNSHVPNFTEAERFCSRSNESVVNAYASQKS